MEIVTLTQVSFLFFYMTKIRTYHSDFEGRTIYFLKYLEKLYTKSLTFCFMSNKKKENIILRKRLIKESYNLCERNP